MYILLFMTIHYYVAAINSLMSSRKHQVKFSIWCLWLPIYNLMNMGQILNVKKIFPPPECE